MKPAINAPPASRPAAGGTRPPRRKTRFGAGRIALIGLLTWAAFVESGAEAGPEPRITAISRITPATAYVPPVPAGTAGTGADGEADASADRGRPGTTRDLLTFIRALEAPRGYADYERRIPIPPPKPLTTMSVGAVLDWQVRVRRSGAPSTAAGGYQIIHPTLKRLVNTYGISRARVFDAAAQDHLARLLISECGRKGPKRNHPRYGNCLAGIWAALPLTHGPGTGRSAHHGVAGNKALTRPQTVLALLAGQPVRLPARGTAAPPPLDPAQAAAALKRIGQSVTRPLAFGANRITVDEINTALRKAKRAGTLTPSLCTWKRDPYAQN